MLMKTQFSELFLAMFERSVPFQWLPMHDGRAYRTSLHRVIFKVPLSVSPKSQVMSAKMTKRVMCQRSGIPRGFFPSKFMLSSLICRLRMVAQGREEYCVEWNSGIFSAPQMIFHRTTENFCWIQKNCVGKANGERLEYENVDCMFEGWAKRILKQIQIISFFKSFYEKTLGWILKWCHIWVEHQNRHETLQTSNCNIKK
jgi:hypothetical protein